MFQNVLIPVALDHLETLPKQIAVAEKLLTEGGEIHAVTVIENIPAFVAEYAVVHVDQSKLVANLKGALDATLKQHPQIQRTVLPGKPGVVLSEFASKNGCDLIVTSAQHPDADDYALGATASRIVRRATCSVIVVR